MYWHLIGPLSVGSLALIVLALSLGRTPWLAFIGLILSATSQASNPLEWGYPATYLHGAALSTGWAVANCVSGYGGEQTSLLQPCSRISSLAIHVELEADIVGMENLALCEVCNMPSALRPASSLRTENLSSVLAGLVGPWMIGAIKQKYGSYVVPMSILAAVNTGAVLYFAVLLRYLPVEKKAIERRAVSEDQVALVPEEDGTVDGHSANVV